MQKGVRSVIQGSDSKPSEERASNQMHARLTSDNRTSLQIYATAPLLREDHLQRETSATADRDQETSTDAARPWPVAWETKHQQQTPLRQMIDGLRAIRLPIPVRTAIPSDRPARHTAVSLTITENEAGQKLRPAGPVRREMRSAHRADLLALRAHCHLTPDHRQRRQSTDTFTHERESQEVYMPFSAEIFSQAQTRPGRYNL
jgi:hypothetical protein